MFFKKIYNSAASRPTTFFNHAKNNDLFVLIKQITIWLQAKNFTKSI